MSEDDQNGDPVHVGSIYSDDPRFDAKVAQAMDTQALMAVQYMSSMTPAGQATAVNDPAGTHNGPGASTPIWGAAANIQAAHDLLSGAPMAAHTFDSGRGYGPTAILAASVGHGPGSA